MIFKGMKMRNLKTLADIIEVFFSRRIYHVNDFYLEIVMIVVGL